MEEKEIQEKTVAQMPRQKALHPDMEVASELVPDIFSAEERTNAHTKWMRNYQTNRLHSTDIERK